MIVATQHLVKDPSEVKDYGWDWSDRLGADVIDTSTWAVDGGLTITDQSFSGSTAIVWLSGGTLNTIATATNTITTTGGRTHERTLKVWIRDL